MFGCAFLLNESIESFKWLFTSFLESMGGKAPKTIFTDEDLAMASAISEVFPHTSHRLCLWHISKNAAKHLGSFNSNKEFRNLLYQCLMHRDSELEFEYIWRNMMNQFEDLKDNDWIKKLYKKREKWCTGLNNEYFSADIKSTQRSESTNSVLNGFVNKTSSLTNFILAFEKLVAGWRGREAAEDFRCKQGIPVIKIKNCNVLKSVTKVYTLRMYKVFEEEFLNGIAKTWTEISSHENTYTFEVISEERRHNENTWETTSKTRIVVFNEDTMDISCSCKKFESMGILCSDALRILSVKNVKIIPEKYILKRWTRSAKSNVIKSADESEEPSKRGIQETETIFRNHLMSRAYNVFFRSQQFDSTRKICREALTRIEMEVEEELSKLTLEVDRVDDKAMNTNPCNNCDKNVTILNPPRVKPKGVGNARLKGHYEKRKTRAKKGSQKLVKQKVGGTNDALAQPMEISQRLVAPSQSIFALEDIPSSTGFPFSMQTMQQNMQHNYNGNKSNMSFTSMMQNINHMISFNQE